MENVTDIAGWLREKRAALDISQAALARRARVSQTTVSNWERGQAVPDEVQLQSLRVAFGEQQESEEPELEGLQTGDSSAGWGGQYPLDAVFVRTDQRAVIDIVRRIKDKRYDLNPEFQRDFVWDVVKQSRLIESCLMRIPLPVLYVAEALDGRIIVVDGLQRLTTFDRYLDNRFKLTFGSNEEGKQHPLEGKRFRDLETKLRERVEDTSLTLYILDSKAPERAKLDIFERVNSGAPLTRQQMRNCLYNGPATRFLRDAVEGPLFKRATGESLDAQKMRDREAINRFCAFSLLGWRRYTSGDMDGFLAEGLEAMNQQQDQLPALRERFDSAMDFNFRLFGQHAFRKSLLGPPQGSRSVLNIALFDVCSVLIARTDPIGLVACQDQIRGAIRTLVADDSFAHAITYSTNSRKQVGIRFERMEMALAEALA